jgi:outer membrane protein
MKIRNLPLAALCLALAPAALAQPPSTVAPQGPLRLTLEQALERALEANLALARARAELPAAEAARRGALALVLPRLNLLANGIRNSTEVAFGSPDDRRIILALNDWNYRFAVSQPIFAGLRDRRAYEQAKLGITTAEEGVRLAEDAVLLQVANDYLGVVLAEGLIDVEQKNLDLARRRRKQAGDLFEVGETTQVDVLRAETAIKEAERRLVTGRRARAEALGRLRVDLALDGDIAVSEPETLELSIPGEAALLTQAEESHPEIRRAADALRSAELEVSKQRGAYWPVLTADAGFIRQRSTFPQDKYGFAALRLTVPLFQGGEVGARVAGAIEREKQAALTLEEARRRVREDVRVALVEIEAATTRLALAREQLSTAEAEYEQTFELYQGQELTSLDVDSAETSLAEARRAVLTGRLEWKLAQIRTFFAAGSLKAALFNKEVSP